MIIGNIDLVFIMPSYIVVVLLVTVKGFGL